MQNDNESLLNPNRIPSLDGLRAVAVAFVIASHLYLNMGQTPSHFMRATLWACGHFGVEIFFVISGFLITHLLLKEREKTGKLSLGAFYRRRAFRILPASLVYIGAVACFAHGIHWKDFIYALTYTVSEVAARMPWFLGHLWSLSVEEQFYLLWPIALFFFFARKKWLAWGVMFITPCVRLLCWKMNLDQSQYDYLFPAVADSIAAGCLLALYRPVLRKRATFLTKKPIQWFIVLLTLLSPVFFRLNPRLNILFSGLISCLIALCVAIAIDHPYRFLNNRAVMFVGTLSYSLYLWQQPFLTPYGAHLWNKPPVNLLLAFACAYASYRLVEKPMLQFKTKRKQPEPLPVPLPERADLLPN